MKVFKIKISKEGEVQFLTFQSKKESNNEGNDGFVFSGQEGLADCNITGSQLAAVYSHLMPEAPVKKFSDRSTAVSRCWEAVKSFAGAQKAPKAPKALREPKTPQADQKTRRADLLFNLQAGATNPYRAGTASAAAFDLAFANPGQTLKQLVELGGRRASLLGLVDRNIATLC